jgi:predicted nucleotidyltransferase
MQRIVTLAERKSAEAVRRAAAVDDLVAALTIYARAHGGRFLLFGSAARGTMRWDSDVDLLVDFPDNDISAAWSFAEQACWDRALEVDILPYAGCKTAFLAHIASDSKVLA